MNKLHIRDILEAPDDVEARIDDGELDAVATLEGLESIPAAELEDVFTQLAGVGKGFSQNARWLLRIWVETAILALKDRTQSKRARALLNAQPFADLESQVARELHDESAQLILALNDLERFRTALFRASPEAQVLVLEQVDRERLEQLPQSTGLILRNHSDPRVRQAALNRFSNFESQTSKTRRTLF